MSEINELTELPFKTKKMAWEKWINSEGQEYLDMNRIISVAQIKMFLLSAFQAGFEANDAAHRKEVKRLEKWYRRELDFVDKMTMKK